MDSSVVNWRVGPDSGLCDKVFTMASSQVSVGTYTSSAAVPSQVSVLRGDPNT